MKARVAREFRQGIQEARNLRWFLNNECSPLYMSVMANAIMKRLSYNAYRAFMRTLEEAEVVEWRKMRNPSKG